MKKELSHNSNNTKLNLQKKTIKRLSNTSMLQMLGGRKTEPTIALPPHTTS